MHQIVVTVVCRLRPPFPEGKCASGNSSYFYRISGMNPQFSGTREWGAQRDARIGGPQIGACLILSDAQSRVAILALSAQHMQI